MKKTKYLTILSALGLVSSMSTPVFAAVSSSGSQTDPNNQSLVQLINSINAQNAALQKEVKLLNKKVNVLEAEANQQNKTVVKTKVIVVHETHVVEAPPSPVVAGPPGPFPPVSPVAVMPGQVNVAPSVGTSVQPGGAKPYVPSENPHLPQPFFTGEPVYTAAYVGDHTAFDPTALVIYYPTYNEDLHLLQQRQTLFSQYAQDGLPPPANPFLQVSGKLEGQVNYTHPFSGSDTSDISLATAELDFIPVINEWTSGFIAFAYDNSLVPNTPLTSNSRIFLDQGFMTFGNLNRMPFYMSIGQMYPPFGEYLSNMITDPLTEDLGQIKARVVLVGFQHPGNDGLYAQVFGYNGDQNFDGDNTINEGGANIGFSQTTDSWNYDVGMSYDGNLADSIFMQDNTAPTSFSNGAPAFGGFGEINGTDELSHRVPALDFHGSFGVGNWGLFAEYLRATTEFAPEDMTFDGHGAQPSAFNAELSYSFPTGGRPSAISVGYGFSRQALGIDIPAERFIATYNISLWKDTVQALEFRHDINYQTSDSATGNGFAVNTQGGLGKIENSITFQAGVYF